MHGRAAIRRIATRAVRSLMRREGDRGYLYTKQWQTCECFVALLLVEKRIDKRVMSDIIKREAYSREGNMVKTDDLLIRVVFRTLKDVLENKRTSYQGTTSSYLLQARDMFNITAEQLENIAEQKAPSYELTQKGSHSLLRKQGFLEKVNTKGSAQGPSKEEVRKFALEMKEYAGCIDRLLENPKDVFQKDKDLTFKLIQFSNSMIQASNTNDPVIIHKELLAV